MGKHFYYAVLLTTILLPSVLYMGCGGTSTPTSPSPSTPTNTHTPGLPTATFTITKTATSTLTLTASPTITSTPTVTMTPTLTSTVTATPLASNTPTVTATTTSTPNFTFSYSLGGTYGSATGDFNAPCGIAATVSGGVTTIYVADTGNNRIQVYNSSSANWSVFAGAGSGTGQFAAPQGVALDPSGNLYATDGGANDRVQKYNGSTWSVIGVPIPASTTPTPGEFKGPLAVASDSSGNIYVTDETNLKNQKYVPGTGWSYLPTYKYSYPSAIGVNSTGEIFIADASYDSVFESDGTSAWSYFSGNGASGSGDGFFSFPYGLAVDSGNNVFVGDTSNSRVQELTSSGTYVTQFGNTGTTSTGKLNGPQGVAVDNLGDVYVSDGANNRIVVFTNVP